MEALENSCIKGRSLRTIPQCRALTTQTRWDDMGLETREPSSSYGKRSRSATGTGLKSMDEKERDYYDLDAEVD